MLSLIYLGLAVGLDNLRVALTLGAICAEPTRRREFAVAFGVCEALMPSLGIVLGRSISELVASWSEVIGAIALGACGVLVIWEVLRRRGNYMVAESKGLLVGLPLALSMDNMAAGFGLGMLGLPVVWSAIVIGVISAAMCFVGLYAGGFIRQIVPSRAVLCGGGLLVMLAVFNLVEFL